jgi:phenylacetate-CoA ligase
MRIATLLRNRLTHLPPPIGQYLAYIPFESRPGIGKVYRQQKSTIIEFTGLAPAQRKDWILRRMQHIVNFAVREVPFYRNWYGEHGFKPSDLKTFEDIALIPPIDKNILQSVHLEERSSTLSDRIKANTGGSSGQTLSLYVQSSQMGIEWAHMHQVWQKLGYATHHLKVSFGGRGHMAKGVNYDSVRHSISVDVYAPFSKVVLALDQITRRRRVFYLHGYPSAIYDFAVYCDRYAPSLLNRLRDQLLGVFLGSEFPNPKYRERIENVFKIPSVSWYGHTERCILAYERDQPFDYYPFQTYGYTEVTPIGNGRSMLLGTSYFNFATPLIRYNTADLVNDVTIHDGVLEKFRIDSGRAGEFVIDRHGKHIPLTGFIHGRHHPLFDLCTHIQVYQDTPGKATILVTCPRPMQPHEMAQAFDGADVSLDIDFIRLEEPVRTISGKIRLLVNRADLQRLP